jgi:ABC-type phosphate/phosphonate transport system substrate-binding protein
MATAGLPMYDLPELHAATDAWWAGIARALRREGIEDVPERLTRDRHTEEIWRMLDLLLSQTCGYNIVGEHQDRLAYIATPCFTAPGCQGPLYSSHIIVPAAAPMRTLEDLRGMRCAINGYMSHSGCNAIRATFAPLADGGRFFGSVAASGGHVMSLALLANGEADVAAIDCVIYALLARCRPNVVENVRIIAQTASAPVGPYVTCAGASADFIGRLRGGLMRAMDDSDLETVRQDLLIGGLEVLGSEGYDRIIQMEAEAMKLGYQDFGQPCLLYVKQSAVR